MNFRSRLAVNLIFAIAMAWVEAAVVIDLRTLVDRLNPYQLDPLPLVGYLGQIELVREAATLVMLLCIGWLCGRTLRSRLCFAAIAFGIWDIFYYIFLRLMGPWPNSLMAWDILFLLPLPWWGPVLAPVLIALLFVLGGIRTAWLDEKDGLGHLPVWSLVMGTGGALLALYVFMADAFDALPGGVEALQSSLPDAFDWPLFLLAYVLMAVPFLEIISRRKMVVGRESGSH